MIMVSHLFRVDLLENEKKAKNYDVPNHSISSFNFHFIEGILESQ
jgi:hypothetical protein